MTADLYENGALEGAYVGKENGWHMRGVSGVNENAVAAHARMGIQPETRVRLSTPDGQDSPWSFIARTLPNGKQEIVSEPARDTWTMITHAEAAAIANRATGGANIETMGLLGQSKGDMMFINYPLRELDLDGTPHKQFLYHINSLRVGTASVLGIGTLRMVCTNTVEAGLASARAIFKTPHRQGVVADTEDWIKEVWQRSYDIADEIVKVSHELQRKKLTIPELESVLEVVLPDMAPPKPTGSVKRDAILQMDRELFAARMKDWRSQIVTLFDGAGMGMNLPTTAGTRWGGLNAVCEFLDHYRPAGQPGGKNPVKAAVARTEMAFMGDSYRIKNRAAQALLKLG